MTISESLKIFERNFIRPISYVIFPRVFRHNLLKLKMQLTLKLKPIKYKYYSGNAGLGKRLCIFISFQKNGIQRTTWKYIRHLKEDLGYGIVLISNCPLQKEEIPMLQDLCLEVIERENIGYDFGGYKDGIIRYLDKLDSLETLLIANDSVIGPIYNMQQIHKEMQDEDCDFWGMNDFHESRDLNKLNTQSIPRVCSYFICFKSNIITTDVFKNYWKNLPYPSGRKLAIRNETKLGQYFLNNKFKYSVFVKKEDIINYISENRKDFDFDLFFANKAMKKPKIENPYFFISYFHTNDTCPMLILTHFKMPLMKRDLIRSNKVDINIFKAILNRYERQLTDIITREEIIDEIGLDPRTPNSIYKWKKYII
jgi:hypothetical protein